LAGFFAFAEFLELATFVLLLSAMAVSHPCTLGKMTTGPRAIRARRYVMPFREGGSVPVLVEGDDLGMYVVKLRGAAQGAKALTAELIVGALAAAAKLPVPEIVFVDLDASMAASEPDPELAEPLEKSIGVNLGLDYLPGSITFDPLADPTPDPIFASRVALFDSLTTNVDRTPRNPNLLCWHRRVWLIDHGACLYFHHDWRREDRLNGALDPFAEIRSHVLLPWASALTDAAEHLRSTLTDEAIADAVAPIPDAWLDVDRSFDTHEAQRAAYVDWLRARRAAIPLLLEEAQRARTPSI
jgi:hypothetical protein